MNAREKVAVLTAGFDQVAAWSREHGMSPAIAKELMDAASLFSEIGVLNGQLFELEKRAREVRLAQRAVRREQRAAIARLTKLLGPFWLRADAPRFRHLRLVAPTPRKDEA